MFFLKLSIWIHVALGFLILFFLWLGICCLSQPHFHKRFARAYLNLSWILLIKAGILGVLAIIDPYFFENSIADRRIHDNIIGHSAGVAIGQCLLCGLFIFKRNRKLHLKMNVVNIVCFLFLIFHNIFFYSVIKKVIFLPLIASGSIALLTPILSRAKNHSIIIQLHAISMLFSAAIFHWIFFTTGGRIYLESIFQYSAFFLMAAPILIVLSFVNIRFLQKYSSFFIGPLLYYCVFYFGFHAYRQNPSQWGPLFIQLCSQTAMIVILLVYLAPTAQARRIFLYYALGASSLLLLGNLVIWKEYFLFTWLFPFIMIAIAGYLNKQAVILCTTIQLVTTFGFLQIKTTNLAILFILAQMAGYFYQPIVRKLKIS